MIRAIGYIHGQASATIISGHWFPYVVEWQDCTGPWATYRDSAEDAREFARWVTRKEE